MKKIILIIFILSISVQAFGALTVDQKRNMRDYFDVWVDSARYLDVLDTRLSQLFNLLSEAQQEALYNQMKQDIQDAVTARKNKNQSRADAENAEIDKQTGFLP